MAAGHLPCGAPLPPQPKLTGDAAAGLGYLCRVRVPMSGTHAEQRLAPMPHAHTAAEQRLAPMPESQSQGLLTQRVAAAVAGDRPQREEGDGPHHRSL